LLFIYFVTGINLLFLYLFLFLFMSINIIHFLFYFDFIIHFFNLFFKIDFIYSIYLLQINTTFQKQRIISWKVMCKRGYCQARLVRRQTDYGYIAGNTAPWVIFMCYEYLLCNIKSDNMRLFSSGAKLHLWETSSNILLLNCYSHGQLYSLFMYCS